MRDTVSVRMDIRWASPGGSIAVNRIATRARPFTRAERSAAVTTPVTAVPAGSAWTPPTVTARRRDPRTASSTWLVSDATAVVSSTGNTVPAGRVTSRYSGAGAAADGAAEAEADSGRSAARAVPAACAGVLTALASARNVEMSDRAISLRPVDVSTVTCSGFTSTSLPTTTTPSFFSTETVLPG